MPMYRQTAATTAERELTQAVRRVVERYGSDLSVYFRHVEEIAKKNARETRIEDTVGSSRDDESAT